MMTEIKKAIKLTRYGYGLKANLFGCIAIILLGVLFLHSDYDPELMVGTMVGTVYIALGPMMLLQVLYSQLYVNIVASSPNKRFMEIVIPDVMNVVSGILGFLVLLGSTLMKVKNLPDQTSDCMEMMVVVSVGLTLLFILYGAAYKYYAVSYILFFVLFFGSYVCGIIFVKVFDFRMNLVIASLISLLVEAIGIVLAGLLRRRLYKSTLSPMACGSSLRKKLQ